MKLEIFRGKLFFSRVLVLPVSAILFFVFNGAALAALCGSANGQTFIGNPPVWSADSTTGRNVCVAGASMIGNVTANGNGTWTWGCLSGTTSEACLAYGPLAGPGTGVCGSANGITAGSAPLASNLCAYGSYLSVAGLSSTQATGYCDGANQNNQDNCEADDGIWILYAPGTGPITWRWACATSVATNAVWCGATQLNGATAGVCGSASGTVTATAPTSGFCSAGNYSGFSSSNPWAWSCIGLNGGSTASCFTVSPAPVNGVCGSENGQSYPFLAAGSCMTGTSANFTALPTSWTWSCLGSGTGSNASCSANKIIPVVNGVCGSANNTSSTTEPTMNFCDNGAFSGLTGSGPWNWTCNGSGGGSNASCIVQVPINGQCGTDDGQTLSVEPTNLCAPGIPSVVSGTGPWNWTCDGVFGGAPAPQACSAQKTQSGFTVQEWKEVSL